MSSTHHNLCIVCNPFFDCCLSAQLSVASGEFVELLDEAAHCRTPIPIGWCLCRRERSGERGLVPWSHLVSAAHAELMSAELVVSALAELKGTLEELDKFARERESESESDDGSSSSSSEDDDADCLGEEETEEDRKRRAAWIAHYVETGQLQMAIDLGWEKQEDEEDEAAEEAGVRETTRDDNLGENQTDQQNTSHVKTAAPALTVSVDGAPTVAMEPSPTIPSPLPAPPTTSLQTVDRIIRGGARVRQRRREVSVRRDPKQGFGFVVDEKNCVVRILPGLAAEMDAELRIGDIIEAVNGRRLKGRQLRQMLARKCHQDSMSFQFTISREVWDDDEEDEQPDGAEEEQAAASKATISEAPSKELANELANEPLRPLSVNVDVPNVAVVAPTPLKSILSTPLSRAARRSERAARFAPVNSVGGGEGARVRTPTYGESGREGSAAHGDIYALKSWSVSWAMDSVDAGMNRAGAGGTPYPKGKRLAARKQSPRRLRERQKTPHAAHAVDAAEIGVEVEEVEDRKAEEEEVPPSPVLSPPRSNSAPPPVSLPGVAAEDTGAPPMPAAGSEALPQTRLESILHSAYGAADANGHAAEGNARSVEEVLHSAYAAVAGGGDGGGSARTFSTASGGAGVLALGDSAAPLTSISGSLVARSDPSRGSASWAVPWDASTWRRLSLDSAVTSGTPHWVQTWHKECLAASALLQQATAQSPSLPPTLPLGSESVGLAAQDATGSVTNGSKIPLPRRAVASTASATSSTAAVVQTVGQAKEMAATLPPAAAAASNTEGSVASAVAVKGPGHRPPPKPPAFMSTMRMEDMLRQAMAAAERDPLHSAREFEQVLGRYQAHPGVLRRKREAETARRQENERAGRACYWSERKKIPEGVSHRTNTLDELVDAGCSWDEAHMLMRFPLLRLLRYTIAQVEAIPMLEFMQFNVDRRMSEHQARACLFFAEDLCARSHDRGTIKGGRGLRSEWLETQRRIFDEMAERAFAPPEPPPKPTAPPPPPRQKPKPRKASLNAPPPQPAQEGGGVPGAVNPADDARGRPDSPEPVLSPEPCLSPPRAVTDAADPPSPVLSPEKVASTPWPEPPAGVPAAEAVGDLCPGFPLPQQASTIPPAAAVMPAAAPSGIPAAAHGWRQKKKRRRRSVEERGEGSPIAPGVPADAPSRLPRPPKFGLLPAFPTELGELLGQGTYGAVYRGTYGGEPAAIKILSLDRNTSAEVQREIALMRACNCEHIVSYKDAFQVRHACRTVLQDEANLPCAPRIPSLLPTAPLSPLVTRLLVAILSSSHSSSRCYSPLSSPSPRPLSAISTADSRCTWSWSSQSTARRSTSCAGAACRCPRRPQRGCAAVCSKPSRTCTTWPR